MPFPLVESIERATLDAVPPETVEEIPGWLLALDSGTVGRAHSAVPLHHDTPELAAIPEIEARYRARGLSPVFRLPVETPSFEPFAASLRERGYLPGGATLVMQGTTAAMAQMGPGDGVRLEAQISPEWSRVYLGEGFDPVDGESRVQVLARASDARYASLRADADADADDASAPIAAVGCACFATGWLGVHGMRTRPAFRGRGLARRLLAAMGQAGQQRDIARAYLQVAAENQLARALYARAGFELAWIYIYWRLPRGRTPA